MSQPEITIRTFQTTDDHQAFFHTFCLAYTPGMSQAEQSHAYTRWHNQLQRQSSFVRTTRRGAFRDSVCLGIYQIDERVLCIGPARVRTGCIGSVGTHPAFQRQGIGSALMRDAIAFAQQHCELLLLNGIDNFYERFGFTNIAGYTVQVIALDDIARLPASPYRVRAATERDGAALLALYQTHYNRFERSAALQEDYLRDRLPQNPPWLACDEQDHPQGYLLLPEAPQTGRADEVAANNWPATLALLHHHAALLQASVEPPAQVQWPRPFCDAHADETADYVPVQWQVDYAPDGEWMARLVDLPGFVGQMEAVWREQVQRAGVVVPGRFTQLIGDYAFTLETDGRELRMLDSPQMDAPTLRLSPSTFLRLVFGWRSVTWAARQPGTALPTELVAVAEILYPVQRIWFPPSDDF